MDMSKVEMLKRISEDNGTIDRLTVTLKKSEDSRVALKKRNNKLKGQNALYSASTLFAIIIVSIALANILKISPIDAISFCLLISFSTELYIGLLKRDRKDH